MPVDAYRLYAGRRPLRTPSTGGGGAFSVLGLTGLVGWWDASDASSFSFHSGGIVSQWNDKSGGAHHMTQSSSSVAPVRGTVTRNGLDTVDFDSASSQRMQATGGSNIITGTTMTFAVVYRANGVSDRIVSFRSTSSLDFTTTGGALKIQAVNNPQWERSPNGGAMDGSPSVGLSNWALIVMTFDGSSAWMYHDGVQTGTATGATGTFDVDEFNMACDQGGGSIGDVTIAEFIVSSADLNATTERAGLESYLMTKWGL